MAFEINRYRRLVLVLGYCTFLWISALIIMPLQVEFAGAIFLLSSMAILLYAVCAFLFRRRKIFRFLKKREPWIALSWLGLLFLISAIESTAHQPNITAVFILLLLFILLLGYSRFKNEYNQKHGLQSMDRRGFLEFAYWALGIGATLVLIVAIINENDELFFVLAPIYFLVLFSLGVRWAVQQWQLIIKLKNEKANTELLHLKSQVNPHFFFNMLNNLYGLVEIDPKKAQKLILQLSDMMRYSIYDGQKELVRLEEEVSYLKNYIDLHKMRYHKHIDIRFDLDMEEGTYLVMPLLFIILLENAFKHGVENLRANAFVYVQMHAAEKEIHFKVENNFDQTELTEQVGIGIKNLRRRLELVYPEKHTLSFVVTKDVHSANLILKL